MPQPCVLLHMVCVAWPGMGGRVAGLELWGKWFARDVAEQALAILGPCHTQGPAILRALPY